MPDDAPVTIAVPRDWVFMGKLRVWVVKEYRLSCTTIVMSIALCNGHRETFLHPLRRVARPGPGRGCLECAYPSGRQPWDDTVRSVPLQLGHCAKHPVPAPEGDDPCGRFG